MQKNKNDELNRIVGELSIDNSQNEAEDDLLNLMDSAWWEICIMEEQWSAGPDHFKIHNRICNTFVLMRHFMSDSSFESENRVVSPVKKLLYSGLSDFVSLILFWIDHVYVCFMLSIWIFHFFWIEMNFQCDLGSEICNLYPREWFVS